MLTKNKLFYLTEDSSLTYYDRFLCYHQANQLKDKSHSLTSFVPIKPQNQITYIFELINNLKNTQT